MATARKLPSGSYRVQQYIETVDGKRVYKSFTADTKKEAEYAAAEYVRNCKHKQEPSSMTVGDAIDRFIELKEPVLSPSTVRGYDVIRRCRLSSLMTISLSALTQEMVQKAVNDDSAKHTPKTVRNAYGLLTAVLKEYAPDFVPRAKLPSPRKRKIIIPEKADVNNMLQTCAVPQDRKKGRPRDGKLLSVVVMLDAILGLRRSEICALEWEDVDFERRLVHVRSAMVQNKQGEWVLKDPKTYDSFRTLDDVPPFMLDAIAELPRTDTRIIPLTPCAVGNRFRRLAQKLGLPEGMHTLRHYNASVMLALGIPDQYAMERMGHATPHMLKTVYQHTMGEGRAQTANAVRGYFEDMHHEMHHED